MKKLPIKILFFALIVILSFTPCQVKTPKEIIQPDALEALLYDYHVVQAMGNESDVSSEYQVKLYYEYVFKKHGVTKSLFDSSMVWYTRHPSHLTQIYADLQERLDNEVAIMQEDKVLAQVTNIMEMDYSADTVDLWEERVVNKLTSAPLNNKMQVSFASDTAFVVGDSVTFCFGTRFFSEDKDVLQNVYATLMVAYADNTTESYGLNISTSGLNVLTMPRDYDRTIKGVDAFLYYMDNDKTSQSGVLLSGVSLLRIHPPVVQEE